MLAFARSLLASAAWPERLIAWEVLAAHDGGFALFDDRLAEEMARGLSGWSAVDTYGVTLLGHAWRERLVSDDRILAWTRSPDRWRRRLALVATVPLNSRAQGGTGDARRTLRVCRALLGDSDGMVTKAMSWALRELAKRDPRAAKIFLVREDALLAALVKREVRNKLTTGLKSPRRKIAARAPKSGR